MILRSHRSNLRCSTAIQIVKFYFFIVILCLFSLLLYLILLHADHAFKHLCEDLKGSLFVFKESILLIHSFGRLSM